MRTRCARVAFSAFCLIATLLGCQSPTTPSVPVWIQILCRPEPQTTRCWARGRHDDRAATETDVSAYVTWSSSDPSVVEVSSRGIARSVAPGRAEIQVSGFGPKSARPLTVFPGEPPLPEDLYGSVVRETGVPISTAGIQGANVQVTYGHNSGRMTTTDDHGLFEFPHFIYGSAEVRVTKAGYRDLVARWVFGLANGPELIMERSTP